MEQIVFFENNNQKTCFCEGDVYFSFLDYAFSCADYFMLVYVNYYGKGYSSIMKEYKGKLKSFEVRCRSNPKWPGTLNTYTPNTTYKVVFYRTEEKAKDILKSVKGLNMWKSPLYPQDLAFFKGNQCWFYSVGHENIAAIIHASEGDFDFLESTGLARRESARPMNKYYENYDEIIE